MIWLIQSNTHTHMLKTINFFAKLYSHIVTMYFSLKDRYTYVRFHIVRLRGGVCYGYFSVSNDPENVIAL